MGKGGRNVTGAVLTAHSGDISSIALLDWNAATGPWLKILGTLGGALPYEVLMG